MSKVSEAVEKFKIPDGQLPPRNMRQHDRMFGAVKIILVLLFWSSTVFAAPMTLEWDAVTTMTDGSPSGAVIYRLYYRSPTGPYLFLASKITTSYTWKVPQVGEWFLAVRAINKSGESGNSNEVHVIVDPCWQEIIN